MTRESLIQELLDSIGICGCSDQDQAVSFLADLLEAGDMRGNGYYAEADDLLSEMLPDDGCLFRNVFFYWLAAAGLTEHGDYGLDSYTLSHYGYTVLEALRTHGTDEALWLGDDWDDEPATVAELVGEPDRTLN